MALLAYPTLFLSALFLIIAISIFRRKTSSGKLPPRPTKLPIIGNLHQLGALPHRSLSQLARKHGPLMYLKLGTMPTVVVSSAKAAKEFMKTHDLDCCSRSYMTAVNKLTYNYLDVGFAPYGPQWREMRKIGIIEFMSIKKVSSHRSMRQEEIDRTIRSIASESVVDLSSMLHSLSMDITCRAAFGRRDSARLHEVLLETQALLAGFFFADYMPALRWLDYFTGMKSRLDKNYAVLDSFYEEIIGERMDPERAQLREGGEDTVDALLRIVKEDSNIMTIEHIKALLMNILLGGSDTSSSVVEWAMTELVRHQKVMKKVQEEVRRTVGKKGKVEESDLPQLEYLKIVVKEVMRLHAPAPLLVHRETMRSFEVGEYLIPAKARVVVNAWAIGREEGSWEMPEEFYPERFIDNPIDMKGQDFQIIPFGAGRRICPGMHLGLVVVELALANLLYSFNWDLPAGMSKENIDMEEANGLVVHRKNALRLVATKYNAAEG